MPSEVETLLLQRLLCIRQTILLMKEKLAYLREQKVLCCSQSVSSSSSSSSSSSTDVWAFCRNSCDFLDIPALTTSFQVHTGAYIGDPDYEKPSGVLTFTEIAYLSINIGRRTELESGSGFNAGFVSTDFRYFSCPIVAGPIAGDAIIVCLRKPGVVGMTFGTTSIIFTNLGNPINAIYNYGTVHHYPNGFCEIGQILGVSNVWAPVQRGTTGLGACSSMMYVQQTWCGQDEPTSSSSSLSSSSSSSSSSTTGPCDCLTDDLTITVPVNDAFTETSLEFAYDSTPPVVFSEGYGDYCLYKTTPDPTWKVEGGFSGECWLAIPKLAGGQAQLISYDVFLFGIFNSTELGACPDPTQIFLPDGGSNPYGISSMEVEVSP